MKKKKSNVQKKYNKIHNVYVHNMYGKEAIMFVQNMTSLKE